MTGMNSSFNSLMQNIYATRTVLLHVSLYIPVATISLASFVTTSSHHVE